MTDTTAPTLSALTFQSSINVASGSKPVAFTVSATDDLSGVSTVDIWFDKNISFDTFGSTNLVGVYDFVDSFSDGQSAYTRTITQFNAPGTYTVNHVDVIDKAGNEHTYTTAQLAALGAQTSLVIQGGTADTTSPTLTSLHFQSAVNVAGGSAPVTFTVGATDDLSGVGTVDIWFDKNINFDTFGSTNLVGVYDLVDSFSDGQSAYTRTIAQFNAPGTYTVNHVDVVDKVGNEHTYTTAQLAALGAQTSLVIQGGTADTTSPTLTSLNFQSTVNVAGGSAPVTFTVGATDDLSGVGTVDIWFDKNISFDTFGSTNLVGVYDFVDSFSDGQSAYTRTITQFNTPGTYTINHVDVVDKVGNEHTYNTAQLTALGAQTSLTIDDTNYPPAITSDGGADMATRSAKEHQTAVTTVSATDPNPGTTLTYSISGGADSTKFAINSATGVLTF